MLPSSSAGGSGSAGASPPSPAPKNSVVTGPPSGRPRGGGTSQCGQTVNRALVIDCTKHLRRVLAVDTAARTAWVEPGLVLNHLN